jgi:hypothetical protein
VFKVPSALQDNNAGSSFSLVTKIQGNTVGA